MAFKDLHIPSIMHGDLNSEVRTDPASAEDRPTRSPLQEHFASRDSLPRLVNARGDGLHYRYSTTDVIPAGRDDLEFGHRA